MTTEGFRDVYEIGRINRPDAYNLYFQKTQAADRARVVLRSKERVRADGRDRRSPRRRRAGALGEKLGAVGHRSRRNHVHQLLRQQRSRSARQEISNQALIRDVCRAPRTSCRRSIASSNGSRRSPPMPISARRCVDYVGEIDQHINSEGFQGLVSDRAIDWRSLRKRASAKYNACGCWKSGPAAGVIGTQALCHASA